MDMNVGTQRYVQGGKQKDVNLSIQRFIKDICKGRERERYCPKIQKWESKVLA